MKQEYAKVKKQQGIIAIKTFIIRQSPRFWWRGKLRIVRRYKPNNFFGSKTLAYMLFSPELDSFSYEIGNQNSIESEVFKFLGVGNPFLNFIQEFSEIEFFRSTRLARFLHIPHSKFSPKKGRHFITFVVARTFRPTLVVESGIKNGLGSHILSWALDINRKSDSGSNSRYVGIDIYPKSGHLARYNSYTTKEVGDSLTYLRRIIEKGERASKVFFISDSTPGEQINQELELAARLTQTELVFAYNEKWVDKIKIPFRFSVANKATISEDALHPFYPGRTLEFVHLIKSN